MSHATETTEKTGNVLLNQALSNMFSDPTARSMLDRRRGVSGKQVRVLQPNSSERSAPAALTETETFVDPKESKDLCPTSWYNASIDRVHNGAADVLTTTNNVVAYAPRALVDQLRDAAVSLAVGDAVQVRVVPKKGKPAYAVTHIKIDDQEWLYTEADAKLAAGAAAAKEKQQQEAEAAAEATKSKYPTGTVKWFDEKKGFGFVQPDDGGKDEFLHIYTVERMLGKAAQLPEKARLSFKRGKGPNGRQQIVAFKILSET